MEWKDKQLINEELFNSSDKTRIINKFLLFPKCLMVFGNG